MKNVRKTGPEKQPSRTSRFFAARPALSAILSIIISFLAATILIFLLLYGFDWFAMLDSAITELIGNSTAVLICIVALGFFAASIALLACAGFRTSGQDEPGGKEVKKQRFPRLCRIDAEYSGIERPYSHDDLTLKQLSSDFRNYAASELGLYYSDDTVRTFIASLCTSKLLIIQGISGTGKTSLAWAFGEYLGYTTDVIPVQPSWKEKTDLIGYYNEFTGKYSETEFLCALYKAGYTHEMSLVLLDEMNIARVEYYFAEFLSMLELRDEDSRNIDVIAYRSHGDPARFNDGKLSIPGNLWYIGTANRDDSTFTISDKVYDRAMVIELNGRADPFEAPHTGQAQIDARYFYRLRDEALEENPVSSETVLAIKELDSYLAEKLGICFGNRIMTQLHTFIPCFCACGGDETEAADIFIRSKILRKLEARSSLLVKRESPALQVKLTELFGEGSMPQCRKYLSGFEK